MWSRAARAARSVVACDFIEAGLSGAAELLVLWDSAAGAASEEVRLWSPGVGETFIGCERPH